VRHHINDLGNPTSICVPVVSPRGARLMR